MTLGGLSQETLGQETDQILKKMQDSYDKHELETK